MRDMQVQYSSTYALFLYTQQYGLNLTQVRNAGGQPGIVQLHNGTARSSSSVA